MMMLWMMSMKSTRNLGFCVFLAVFLVNLSLVTCGTTPLKKRSLVLLERNGAEADEPSSTDQQTQKLRLPNKRTFCNAFTGCGRKRSDGSMPPVPSKDYDYETPTETSDDGVVDDIARDILAEARLWEALQARSAMRTPFRRQPGFFPRQKRESDNEADEAGKNN